jgi:hypothetical protein
LAKVVGDYLDSRRAGDAVGACLAAAEEGLDHETSGDLEKESESTDSNPKSTVPKSNRIRARTARRWLEKLGFKYGTVRKGVYIDGHERPDVVSYRKDVFIPKWKEIERRLVIFKEDGTWELPAGMLYTTGRVSDAS